MLSAGPHQQDCYLNTNLLKEINTEYSLLWLYRLYRSGMMSEYGLDFARHGPILVAIGQRLCSPFAWYMFAAPCHLGPSYMNKCRLDSEEIIHVQVAMRRSCCLTWPYIVGKIVDNINSIPCSNQLLINNTQAPIGYEMVDSQRGT